MINTKVGRPVHPIRTTYRFADILISAEGAMFALVERTRKSKQLRDVAYSVVASRERLLPTWVSLGKLRGNSGQGGFAFALSDARSWCADIERGRKCLMACAAAGAVPEPRKPLRRPINGGRK
jgi:hypothetical protein